MTPACFKLDKIKIVRETIRKHVYPFYFTEAVTLGIDLHTFQQKFYLYEYHPVIIKVFVLTIKKKSEHSLKVIRIVIVCQRLYKYVYYLVPRLIISRYLSIK